MDYTVTLIISWPAVNNASHYTVMGREASGNDDTRQTSWSTWVNKIITTHFEKGGLEAGKQYEWKIIATNAEGSVESAIFGFQVNEMPPSLSNVRFSVKQESDLSAVFQASVTIGASQSTTDISGASDWQLHEGSYEYSVSKTGFLPATGTFIVANSDLFMDVLLKEIDPEAQYEVDFQVYDIATLLPVENATITIQTVIPESQVFERSTRFASETGVTGADGYLKFEGLTYGLYNYSVEKSEYASITNDFQVNSSGVSFNLYLIPGATQTEYAFAVTVLASHSSLPVSGATVTIFSDESSDTSLRSSTKDATVLFSEMTNEEGMAIFNVFEGSYYGIIEKASYNGCEFFATVTQNTGKLYYIDLTPPTPTELYHVDIRVLATDTFLPIQGATVTLASALSEERESDPAFTALRITHTGVTDTQGIAAFDIETGDYTVTIQKNLYEPKSVELNVSESATFVCHLSRIKKNIAFEVKHAQTATPLAGVAVDINGTVGNTNASGVVSFSLLPGIYPWSLSLSGYVTQTGSTTLTESADVNVPISLSPIPEWDSFVLSYVEDPAGGTIFRKAYGIVLWDLPANVTEVQIRKPATGYTGPDPEIIRNEKSGADAVIHFWGWWDFSSIPATGLKQILLRFLQDGLVVNEYTLDLPLQKTPFGINIRDCYNLVGFYLWESSAVYSSQIRKLGFTASYQGQDKPIVVYGSGNSLIEVSEIATGRIDLLTDTASLSNITVSGYGEGDVLLHTETVVF